MARLRYKNTFGSLNSKLDLQRIDLFKVTLELPSAIGLPWDENVEFAIENFPFPERSVETTQIKYMQQTNHLVGGDTATNPIDLKVRYTFAQRTAEALEKWLWLIRNPVTGGVGLTTEVKCKGIMRWLVPNMTKQIADLTGTPVPGEDTMLEGLTYVLEGCLLKGLKFVDADMTQSGYVNLMLSLQIDRYYAENPNTMQIIVP